MNREQRAEDLRRVAMNHPAFCAGYVAMSGWFGGPPAPSLRGTPGEQMAAMNAARPWPQPTNPYPVSSADALQWTLGAEQADLEDSSPDSWRDGGNGMDRGVLRQVAEEERAEMLGAP